MTVTPFSFYYMLQVVIRLYRPEILENRTYLLTIIAIITVTSALSPFFIGHVFSFELLIHDLVHATGIALGLFLTILSIYAYFNTKNSRLIWTGLAFATFVLLSVVMLNEDMSEECDIVHYPCIHDSPADTLVETMITIMIGFFAIGVFYHDKRSKFN